MPPIRRRRAASKARTSTTKKIPRQRSSDKPKPLVERTNALPLEEFVSLYIPSSELKFQKEKKEKGTLDRATSTAHENLQVESEETKDEHRPSANTTSGPKSAQVADEEKDKKEDTYALSIHTASTIQPTELTACFNLIEITSSTAYKNSSMKWSPTEKRKEMKLPDMKYMIMRRVSSNDDGDGNSNDIDDEPKEVEGFIEFMVTYEDGYEVLYCYEIHLAPKVQGQRLGEELMSRFEGIGRRIGLEKAMLTVFKSNNRAIKFYERVGYTEDEYSPRPKRLRNGSVKEADYLIMSKMLR
ncbi:acyl-CoA N-acyltransferase [Aspergillus californicus]